MTPFTQQVQRRKVRRQNGAHWLAGAGEGWECLVVGGDSLRGDKNVLKVTVKKFAQPCEYGKGPSSCVLPWLGGVLCESHLSRAVR